MLLTPHFQHLETISSNSTLHKEFVQKLEARKRIGRLTSGSDETVIAQLGWTWLLICPSHTPPGHWRYHVQPSWWSLWGRLYRQWNHRRLYLLHSWLDDDRGRCYNCKKNHNCNGNCDDVSACWLGCWDVMITLSAPVKPRPATLLSNTWLQ